MAERKMRKAKMPSIISSGDDKDFDSFVGGADPLHDTKDNGNGDATPWEGLPKTPKARMMLLLEPGDKARLDYLSAQSGRSVQYILRSYVEPALRAEADKTWNE